MSEILFNIGPENGKKKKLSKSVKEERHIWSALRDVAMWGCERETLMLMTTVTNYQQTNLQQLWVTWKRYSIKKWKTGLYQIIFTKKVVQGKPCDWRYIFWSGPFGAPRKWRKIFALRSFWVTVSDMTAGKKCLEIEKDTTLFPPTLARKKLEILQME